MANFNNRDNRNGNNRFGGGRPTYGDNHSGKRDFSKKRWGDDNRSGDRPVILHEATCAECGKTCEVPFLPIQGKPVYCKDCFGKQRSTQAGGPPNRDNRGDRFEKRDFGARGPIRPSFDNRGNSDAVTRQLEAVNIKLERLIKAVEILAFGKSVETQVTGKMPTNTRSDKKPQEIFVTAAKTTSPKKKTSKKTKTKA
ncbi:MAG: hypothetical protein A3G59_00835 [Candidatus Taylorbacteria bacterium RIFCSPLOWO2_12_FULL_47_20]|uniref:CxxC-x17-CxxC domain-containing protein n=2 Tax=Candidatus Tayloriibacteriota TaxID=1817919 RepID=A0A1G2P9E6_9BACT|nr:MAG: hypothetical protein A3H68_00755 [Candidatus Taylorbacteria bacterium RIFCSPLOWO2_02_FULL_46_40]OHA44954.1 MAG: hypothetical protein A3G59_00835 [Candidatus Taylorbacteria bacterium RIFCSPLOWO2_12_FULL_47_20]